jgi:ATP-dependent DNA helicase RecG
VTEPEKHVLMLLMEDTAYTYQTIADKLSVSRKTVFYRIKSLKEKDIIKRIGSDIKGHWEIIE